MKKKKRDVRRAARSYIRKGRRVVPVKPFSKAPRNNDWQKRKISENEVNEHFHPSDNIGLVLGEPSGGLIDIDCDCDEAVGLAKTLLPPTEMISGRQSRPLSHYWYKVREIPKYRKYTGLNDECLLERRVKGQTVAPPSIHPSGEKVIWHQTGDPAEGCDIELLKTVPRLAAGALLAQHWPKRGIRHELTLALAGALLRAGWEPKEVETFIAAVAKQGGDEEWYNRVNDVRTTVSKLEAGEPVTGLPTFANLLGNKGSKLADKVKSWLELGSESAVSGGKQHAAWPTLDKRALQGLAGRFVRFIEPQTESDIAGLLVQLLAGVGNVIGRGPYYHVAVQKHYTIIWPTLVGETAKGRKGTAWRHIETVLSSVDSSWTKVSGLTSGEGVIWEIRDARIEKRKREDEDGNVDYEFEEVEQGVEDKRRLIVEEEFTSPLRVMQRDGNTLSPILREAWDGIALQTMAKNSPAKASEPHITIIGHTTRIELLKYLNSTEAASGFANRFLFVLVRRSKYLPDGGKVDPDQLRELVAEVKEAVSFAKTVHRVRQSRKARRLWHKIYRELSEGQPGLMGAVLSRAEAQVTRIATIYALMDRSSIIRTQHLRGALALWRYCEDSARFIFGAKLGDPVADEILRSLRASSTGLTRTEISELFARHKTAQIASALATLLEQGLVRCTHQETDGRPVERWYATGGAKKAKKAKKAGE